MNPSSLLTLPSELLRNAGAADRLISPNGERAERSMGMLVMLVTLVAALAVSMAL